MEKIRKVNGFIPKVIFKALKMHSTKPFLSSVFLFPSVAGGVVLYLNFIFRAGKGNFERNLFRVFSRRGKAFVFSREKNFLCFSFLTRKRAFILKAR